MNKLNILTIIFVFLLPVIGKSQTGTYQKSDRTGASCTIAIQLSGKTLQADVFAWWNTKSAQHGTFNGTGILKNGRYILNDANDPDGCKVTIAIKQGQLSAQFANCMANNLPEDFSGTYKQISKIIPGEYTIEKNKAFFYTKPDLKRQTKAYLIKGNIVSVDLENIRSAGWVYINYQNSSGKNTEGYMQIADLK